MHAAHVGYLERACFLLDRGARADTRSEEGHAALMFARREGHLEVIRELLARGYNANASITETGETSLMWASLQGNHGVVRELAGRGVINVNAATAEGSTALMFASYKET